MIKLIKGEIKHINPTGEFFSSVGNLLSSAKTFVNLSYDDNFLHISFRLENNPFLKENTYTKDNDTLYKQEVFEIFVAKGSKSPLSYLEVEINPNNALFLGEIYNPSGIGGDTKILRMLDEALSEVKHSVSLQNDSWSGEISIPFSLIDSVSEQKDASQYKINFYRVLLKEKPSDKDWFCTVHNSEFLCYNSTLSPEKPNFHITSSLLDLLLE